MRNLESLEAAVSLGNQVGNYDYESVCIKMADLVADYLEDEEGLSVADDGHCVPRLGPIIQTLFQVIIDLETGDLEGLVSRSTKTLNTVIETLKVRDALGHIADLADRARDARELPVNEARCCLKALVEEIKEILEVL